MTVLDENIPESQRALLRAWRIRARHIGAELGAKGLQDDQVTPLLQSLGRVTFFTLDKDFANARLCHPSYCLVYLDVEDDEVAAFVRRLLRHPDLNTRAKRMGAVVRASHARPRIWRRNAVERLLPWP